MFRVTSLVGFGGRASSKLTTVSLQAQNNGDDSSIEYPGGIASGDLAIIFNGGETTGLVTPSGYTVLSDLDNGVIYGVVSAKVLTGSESTETGMAPGGGWVKWSIAIFRGDAAITSFTSRSMNEFAGAGNPPSQTVTSGSTPSYPIIIWGEGASNNVWSGTETLANQLTTSSNQLYAKYELDDSGASNETWDKDDNGHNFSASGYLTLND